MSALNVNFSKEKFISKHREIQRRGGRGVLLSIELGLDQADIGA
jgi:hypothetical protein